MNWYKRAAIDQTLVTVIFNILWEAYRNPALLVDLHTRLGVSPNYLDPTTLGDSLSEAQNRFMLQTGEQGLNEAQNNIVREIKMMLEDGPQAVDGLTETLEVDPNMSYDQEITGPTY